MATFDWDLDTAGDVTLVHVAVRSDVTRAVRIENELSGPVWPPRTQGQPLPGWDEDGYVGTVVPESPLLLGYATPAEPAEPPVSLAVDANPGTVDEELTPAALVRVLGEAGPPRAAVPELARNGTDADTADGPEDPSCPEAGTVHQRHTGDETNSDRSCRDATAGPSTLPPALDSWLAAVEERVARCEAQAGPAATTTDAGAGTAPDADIASQLAADRAAVADLQDRTEALVTRLEHLPGDLTERPG
jgi:hypothetical protein